MNENKDPRRIVRLNIYMREDDTTIGTSTVDVTANTAKLIIEAAEALSVVSSREVEELRNKYAAASVRDLQRQGLRDALPYIAFAVSLMAFALQLFRVLT